MKRSIIHGVIVSSKYPFIVYGRVRGLVSQHRSGKDAVRSVERDWRGCRKQGGYSDACVYAWRGQWVVISSLEHETLWGGK